uniref:Polyketide synthase n=1 Tax=Alternaria alternantherae TaxID=1187899 RepID=A0A1C9HK96_9PLEO|nr:polyketide synthase [Alternaria alternantherae]
MRSQSSHFAPSVAFFCPQSKAPTEAYLEQLQRYIVGTPLLQPFAEAITSLRDTWNILCKGHADIANLKSGERHIASLERWITNGIAGPVSSSKSGILALPLLVVIQICQYLQLLELYDLTHEQMLSNLRNGGGIQGYCGGLPTAFATSCAKDEEDLVHLATKALRLAFAVGVFGELGDDETTEGGTTIAVRLRASEQAEELVEGIPGCYISAITDPKTISIVGPVVELKKVADRARDQGLLVTDIHIRGKVHNPENAPLVKVLFDLCQEHDDMTLPDASQLRAPVRSNLNGKLLENCSLTYEAINTILASRCEWYRLLKEVAQDLTGSGTDSHTFALFGIGDPVPLMPFHTARLRVSKVEAHTAIREARLAEYRYPEDAIAITGVSCRLPRANDLEELWQLLAAGTSTCEEIRHDRVPMHESFRALQNEKWKPKWFGNFIDGADEFDFAFFRSNAKEAASMDPQQRILLELTFQALDSAGYLRRHVRENGDRVGCFIGASFVEYTDNTGAHAPTAYTATGTIRAFLCGRLSYHYGWTGPAEVIDTACSSSLVAINRACQSIWSGECPMAVAGGVNIISGVHNYLNLGKAGFLSPTGQCKPFDQSADGYCRADGAGMIVLKPLRQALADGDQVLGVIPASSTNQGGLSASLTVTQPSAQVSLYQSILKRAGMSPNHVSYVEAHGTGTQAGDPLEVSSIRDVFGGSDRPTKMYLGSIKANTGHAESAAGVAGLLKVIAMLQKKAIPPHALFNSLNPKIPSLSPDRIAIAKSLEPWEMPFRAAMVNNYGAAGSNASLVVCEGPQKSNEEAKMRLPENTQYPIILSAHAIESLKAYAESLRSYISRENPDLASLAYTLSERRKRHSVAWMTTASDIAGLETELSATIRPCNITPSSKHVVLAFSGQSKQTIGLSETLYNSVPRLRHYVEKCERILLTFGCPSIIPGIFQTSTITDPVLLQTGTMAVQYASAMCWMDAGIQPACSIGHSFGELSALAVSGVLSIEDALKLVATRAQLMATKWGPEGGTMLAIFAPAAVVMRIVEAVGSNSLEIACFNAPNSQVVVGTQAAVADAENLLATDSSLKGIRSQRLDVTHGFHSVFTEPIRSDLAKSLELLTFKEASIPIEPCTQAHTSSITAEHVVSHLRQPVYFVDAVQRIEKRLGDCIWLEAGFDSPIIPMVKRASAKPETHSFYSIKTAGAVHPTHVLSQSTIDLWKEGVDATPWTFLSPSDAGVEPIWLPPYQFQRSKAWLENIDRATELQKTIATLVSQRPEPASVPTPIRLVCHAGSNGSTEKFAINNSASRFRKVISGHAVRGRPLCPASMYMECATMSALLLGADLNSKSLMFEDLSFESPLGVNLDRDVSLSLDETTKYGWKFTLSSSSGSANNATRTTVHGRGQLLLIEDPRFSTYKRLIADRLDSIRSNPNAEKLNGGRAYKLFSKVVDYADFFHGIQSIVIDKNEALAEIRMPDPHIGGDESSVTKHCDTVSIDAFIQVSGLLINSSKACPPGQVFVASGLENVTMSKHCDFDVHKEWSVYAIFTLIDDVHATGDVFVLTKAGEVAMTAIGAKFHRLEISKLERTLDAANGSKACSKEDPRVSLPTSIASNQKSRPTIVQPPTSLAPDSDSGFSSASSVVEEESDDREGSLKTIISTYTGAPADFIASDTCIGDLGIDSLASVELSDEISERFGKLVSPGELLTMSFGTLSQIIFPGATKINRKHATPSTKKAATTPSPLPEVFETKSKAYSSFNQSLVESPGDTRRTKLFQLISELCGADVSQIQEHQLLQDLGFDSLSTTELGSSISDEFDVDLNSVDTLLDVSVKELMQLVGISSSQPGSSISAPSNSQMSATSTSGYDQSAGITEPFQSLLAAESSLQDYAMTCQFTEYLAKVAARQDQLLLAYLVEGFQKLGIDLKTIRTGEKLPCFTYQPKHKKVVQRYYEILEKHSIIKKKDLGYVRSSGPCTFAPSAQLLQQLIADFPQYSCEAKLMALTGPKVAECLTGTEDAVKLLFGTSKSQEIVGNFYTKAPMFATLTEVLVDFMVRMVQKAKGPVRILEVGAGMGGTSTRLGEALDAVNHPIEYFFTDISSTLVRNASKKFKYPWMQFKTLNLEVEPPTDMVGKFDVIISTNCVHATVNRTNTCRRIKQMLNSNGLLVLSEITTIFDWHEVVFGLLDGWWLANDATHAIQPPAVWMEFMHQAGFPSATYSHSTIPDCNLQRLLVASAQHYPEPPRPMESPVTGVETVVYKSVDGVEIEADIYLPNSPPTSSMPVALMIHGGGHMTLSRKAVRPAQTKFLLSHNILPISVDYRLVPEVNVIEGPFSDVRDAYAWIQTKLSAITSKYGIPIDTTRVVSIGWSTGAHLAMSLVWTTKELNLSPLAAILGFYGPTDFESGALEKHHNEKHYREFPARRMRLEKIMQSLPRTPITNYGTMMDSSQLGWIKPGDPRSELIFAVLKEGIGLSVLLHGLSHEALAMKPDPELVGAISPIAHVREGSYDVPTFIIHGTEDEIVPFDTAESFVKELENSGVECGFLPIPGAKHIHDLHLKPGSEEWNDQVEPGYRFLFEILEVSV